MLTLLIQVFDQENEISQTMNGSGMNFLATVSWTW